MSEEYTHTFPSGRIISISVLTHAEEIHIAYDLGMNEEQETSPYVAITLDKDKEAIRVWSPEEDADGLDPSINVPFKPKVVKEVKTEGSWLDSEFGRIISSLDTTIF